MGIVFILCGLLLLVIGVAMGRSARRSLREGHDPHCVACGRNLRGLDEPERCPECGRDLGEADAVTRGRPTADRTDLTLAGLAVAGGLALLIAGGKSVYKLNWSPLMVKVAPDSWLLDGRATPGARAAAASTELKRRFGVSDRSPEDRLALGLKAFPLTLDARSSVSSGQDLDANVDVPTPSYSSDWELAGEETHSLWYDAIDWRWNDRPAIPWNGDGGNAGQMVGWSVPWWFPVPDDLPPGEHELTIRVLAGVTDKGTEDLHHGAPLLAETVLTHTFKVEVLPADDLGVTVNTDLSLAAAMQAAFTDWSAANSNYSEPMRIKIRPDGDQHYVNLRLRHLPLPLPVSADLLLRDSDGREFAIGGFTCGRASGGCRHHMRFYVDLGVPDPAEATVGLVLRPNPEHALDTTNVYEIWGGEIVIPNVPVEHRAER